VLSTLNARWPSQLNSTVNNDLIRLSVFSIFALFLLLGTNQGARVQRPALAAALRACRAGDMLVVWKLDRLGRNTKHRIEIVEELE
jgi:DNA invertase Pin-like site-specific DNA recombinase